MTRTRDTIAAVATPAGQGGLAVVRVSGPEALAVAEKVFTPSRSGASLDPFRLRHGHVADDRGLVADEVLASYMPGPTSYTGEDTVEFSGHGGSVAARTVLETVLAAGAPFGVRQAERGEFTRRAFLNGRLDLTQAEAVAELIHAPTKSALHLAQTKLSGVLGGRIETLRRDLAGLQEQFCLAVDFPEDEVECLPPEALDRAVARTMDGIGALLAGVDRARAWREGVLAVLAGRVNAGKSSLLNALLGRDRAIVAEEPGTTRDYIEEPVNLDGLVVRLADTAGLRDAGEGIERAGMDRGRDLARRADLVLFVTDGSAPLAQEDVSAARAHGPGRTLAVVNKDDLQRAEPDPLAALEKAGLACCAVSAKTGRGLDDLARTMRRMILAGSGEPDPDEIAPNARQAGLLRRAREELAALRADADRNTPPDLLSVRLDTACRLLDHITGYKTPESVLDDIFNDFCIGK